MRSPGEVVEREEGRGPGGDIVESTDTKTKVSYSDERRWGPQMADVMAVEMAIIGNSLDIWDSFGNWKGDGALHRNM